MRLDVRIIAIAAVATAAASAPGAAAQAADSLRLAVLQREAAGADPRDAQRRLLEAQARLRLATIAAEQRPGVTVEALAQYQSDVARLSISLPGVTLPAPRHELYDLKAVVQYRLFDPTRAPRMAVESARLDLSTAQVAATLHALRHSVSAAFFGALRAQGQLAELDAAITDLLAQEQSASARVRGGTALPSEELAIRAELLRRRQLAEEWRANRSAALAVLGHLSGRRIDSTTILALDDQSGAVMSARTALAALKSRPEFAGFAATRAMLDEQAKVVTASTRPRVSAFARTGYGQPGLNPLGARLDAYWVIGIQGQWDALSRGQAVKDREALMLQRRIVDSDEAAFAAAIRRDVEQDLAAIDRLTAALATDEDVIVLRERILAEARVRHREGVISSAEFVDRQTDLLAARAARALHRVELAQARARFLTTLGVESR